MSANITEHVGRSGKGEIFLLGLIMAILVASSVVFLTETSDSSEAEVSDSNTHYINIKLIGTKDIINPISYKSGDTFDLNALILPDGYSLVKCQSSDVTIDSEGCFTMPDKDITVTLTVEPLSYKITYYLDSTVYKTETVKYRENVIIPDVPGVSGKIVSPWACEDSKYTNDFEMPAKDLVFRCTSSALVITPVSGNVNIFNAGSIGFTNALLNDLKDAIGDNGKFTVVINGITMTFDKAAVQGLTDAATLKAENRILPLSDIPLKFVAGKFVDIGFGNNTVVSGGKVTVSVPFTPKESFSADDLIVCSWKVGGESTEVNHSYADGRMTFEINSFSQHVIAYKTPDVGGMCGSTIAAIFAIAGMVAVIPVVRYIRF